MMRDSSNDFSPQKDSTAEVSWISTEDPKKLEEALWVPQGGTNEDGMRQVHGCVSGARKLLILDLIISSISTGDVGASIMFFYNWLSAGQSKLYYKGFLMLFAFSWHADAVSLPSFPNSSWWTAWAWENVSPAMPFEGNRKQKRTSGSARSSPQSIAVFVSMQWLQIIQWTRRKSYQNQGWSILKWCLSSSVLSKLCQIKAFDSILHGRWRNSSLHSPASWLQNRDVCFARARLQFEVLQRSKFRYEHFLSFQEGVIKSACSIHFE